MEKTWKLDYQRVGGNLYKHYLKRFAKLLRKSQESKSRIIKNLSRLFFHLHCLKHQNEIYSSTKIGPGFTLWHPYNITVGSAAIIGKNVTLNKGCLIGHEFRGERRGDPIIGNDVWIGTNAVVVGKIKIGDDVLIAPNSFVNCDVPSHSVVFGNPCVIKKKEDAVCYYIQSRIN